MAEIRKHNPKRNAIAEAVRAAAGETIRPVQPGRIEDRTEDPFAEKAGHRPAAASFSAGGAPLIGQLPPSAASWFITPKSTVTTSSDAGVEQATSEGAEE